MTRAWLLGMSLSLALAGLSQAQERYEATARPADSPQRIASPPSRTTAPVVQRDMASAQVKRASQNTNGMARPIASKKPGPDAASSTPRQHALTQLLEDDPQLREDGATPAMTAEAKKKIGMEAFHNPALIEELGLPPIPIYKETEIPEELRPPHERQRSLLQGPAAWGSEELLMVVARQRAAVLKREQTFRENERRLLSLRAETEAILSKVEARLKETQELKEGIAKDLLQRADQRKKMGSPVQQMYLAMPPDEAAKLLVPMSNDAILGILEGMAAKKSSAILAEMAPARASAIMNALTAKQLKEEADIKKKAGDLIKTDDPCKASLPPVTRDNSQASAAP